VKRIMLGLIAALMGGAILVWCWNTSSRIKASATWPATDGEVVRSAVALDSSRIRGGGYNVTYRADIHYRYVVNGKSYESSTFTFGVPHSFANRAEADAEVARLAVGRHVEVHYDPEDPATSCLETGVVPDTIRLLAWMAGAFTLAGIISILSGVLSRRRRA
jgi:hypothetical protein